MILNPVVKSIKENEWRLVASNVTNCNISKLDENQNCLYTYRITGGSIDRSDEVVLTKGKKYLLRVTNKSTSANPINIGMSWYEV